MHANVPPARMALNGASGGAVGMQIPSHLSIAQVAAAVEGRRQKGHARRPKATCWFGGELQLKSSVHPSTTPTRPSSARRLFLCGMRARRPNEYGRGMRLCIPKRLGWQEKVTARANPKKRARACLRIETESAQRWSVIHAQARTLALRRSAVHGIQKLSTVSVDRVEGAAGSRKGGRRR